MSNMVTHNPCSWEEMAEELPRVRGLVCYSVSRYQKAKEIENKKRFSDSLNAVEKEKGSLTHPSPIPSHTTTLTCGEKKNLLLVLFISLEFLHSEGSCQSLARWYPLTWHYLNLHEPFQGCTGAVASQGIVTSSWNPIVDISPLSVVTTISRML